MSVGDSLLRQIDSLRKALNALQSGLPGNIVVVTTDEDSDRVRAQVLEKLKSYGLDSLEDLEMTHTRLTVIQLPWMDGRSLKPRVNDIVTEYVSKQDPDLTSNDMEIMGIGAEATSDGAPTRRTFHKNGAQK